MAGNPNQSVFMPVDPKAYEGPFSSYLQPVQAAQPPQQAQPTTAVGGVAHVATQFLQGASEARMRAYQQQENQKLQSLQTLQSYIQNLNNNPDTTDEARAMANNAFFQALGGAVQNAGPVAGAKPGTGNTGTPENPGIGHKAAEAIKEIAIGMTGGKAPKGAPDVGGTMATIHGQLFNPDGTLKDQYSRKALNAQDEAAMQKTLATIDPAKASLDDAIRAVGPQLASIAQRDPARAEQLKQIYLGPYNPPTGAELALQGMNRIRANSGTPPAPATSGQPSAPPAAAPGPPAVPAAAAPPPVGQPGVAQAVPTSNAPGAIDMTRAWLYHNQKLGVVGNPENVDVTMPDGTRKRMAAMFISNPEYNGWADALTKQPLPPEAMVKRSPNTDDRGWRSDNISVPVRKATFVGQDGKTQSTEVFQDPSGHWRSFKNGDPIVAKDNQISLSADARFVPFTGVSDLVTGKNLSLEGPTQPRPTAARKPIESAAAVAAKRRVDALDAASKIITDYTTNSGTKATGPDLMKEIEGALPAYLRKKAYQPFAADIYSYVRNELRQGTFKDPGEMLNFLKSNKTDAKQELTNQQLNDKIDQMSGDVVDHLNEIWGQMGNQQPPAAQPRNDPMGLVGNQPPAPVQQ